MINVGFKWILSRYLANFQHKEIAGESYFLRKNIKEKNNNCFVEGSFSFFSPCLPSRRNFCGLTYLVHLCVTWCCVHTRSHGSWSILLWRFTKEKETRVLMQWITKQLYDGLVLNAIWWVYLPDAYLMSLCMNLNKTNNGALESPFKC
jgi:hypothetical protein